MFMIMILNWSNNLIKHPIYDHNTLQPDATLKVERLQQRRSWMKCLSFNPVGRWSEYEKGHL